jgi:hypothetical protein
MLNKRGGSFMKIKKLWLAVLTLVLVYAMGTYAYAWSYSGNHLDAYDEGGKVYIKLPKGTSTTDTVTVEDVDTAIVDGKKAGVIQDTTEIGIVILSDNYQDGLTGGRLPENILNKYKERITSVSVTGSGTIPFPKLVDGCINLKSVVISDTATITKINDSAFSGCESLESIVIPKGVTSIGDSAFSGCESLESVVISEGVITIGATS